MKPRILQLIDSFDQGGSERQALQLTRLLRESGKFEVFLASLKPDGALLADAEKLGVGAIASYPLKNFYDLNAILQLRKFVHYLRASKIDVLHTHDFYTNIFGMVAGSLAGVKVRVASRRETSGMRSNAQRRAQQFAYSLAHQIVANSQSVRRQLIEEGVSTKRITVIHNGLEIERILPPACVSREEALADLSVPDAAKTCTRFVTIVANMRHGVKDYPMFLHAAQQVSQALPNIGFLLAGEGELRSSIEQLAIQLGIGNNTFFLGRCENLGGLLNVSDVCVLSSKAEGFSNSILEYMAAAKPVVATDVGGASEAVVESETGYLVASGDESLMAERIISLLRGPEKARLMGERGRRVVEEKFSQQALMQNTEALYEKLLNGRQAGAKAAKVRPETTSDVSTVKQGEQPLRILVVAPSFDILGGQSVQAARLISRLRELSFLEVGFLPINPRLPGLLRKLQAIKYLRTIVTSFLYIATLLARVPKYDVIHIFSASYFSFVLAPTPAILIAKLFGKRILLNYHSGEAEDHLRRWPSAVATIRRVDEVAVPSEYLVKVFAKFGLRARAINNLIELDKFTFRERNPLKPIFLSNRNFEAHYGVDRILRAFARIQAQFPDAELIVAGDGEERGSLENLARELALRKTEFIGRVDPQDIAAQYQAADIYLNGSEIDNQPLSILEAFACGLAVVTTDAGGIPDMVTDGSNGLIVSRGDHQALADRAIRLLADSELSRSLAHCAREECKNYTWDAVRDRWVKLYSELKTPGAAKDESEPQPGSRIQKLIGMSFDEIRVRGSQLFAAFAERQGWSSLTKLPSDRAWFGLHDSSSHARHKPNSVEDLLEHFRRRNKPVLSAALTNPIATPEEFRNRWPGAAHEILDEADCIVAGKFNLLGIRNLNFGNPIKWNLEPVSGKSTPSLHWSLIDYLDPEIAGDKKIIWELNRHQHFVKLGQAYWLNKDEKYATAFVSQLESWMDLNPPKLGINWASSLEIALRSISWLWALYFFKNSPSLTSATLKRALKFLYLNARHLETYASTYFSPNTHLTGEALGLFYLGTLLPEFREAGRWRTTGRRILVEQLAHQVKPDGVYFEQSSYYHRYTTDFYTHFSILSHANGEAVPGLVTEKLTALLDHLMFITRPDGTTPLFGDDDGGRLLTLDRRRSDDFRAALSTGAALFGRSDYKCVAGELAEETFWLLGTQGVQDFDRIAAQEPAHQSKDFPVGGYYVMRDGWHRQSNYLLFDCGPHGTDNCGHAHADALAIEVTTNGRAILVDPGTCTYTGSKERRDWFRGSRAHNVLLVDGQPSSVPAGPFSWRTIASCKPLSWINGRRFDFVAGRHNGYERLPQPATHTRSILFLKNDYWVVRDSVASTGDHQVELPFHFASEVNPQLDLAGGHPHIVETGAGEGLLVAVFGKGQWSREEGWVSHSYGERVAAPVCVFSARSQGNGELITLLLPKSGKTSLTTKIKEVEAIGGRALEIVNEDHCDLVLLRDPNASRVETVRLISDFNWTWARFSQTSSGLPEELLEFVVLDGQRLELDGKEILRSGKHVDYLVASRIGNKFRLEMDERVLNLSLPVNDLESLFAEAIRQSGNGKLNI